MLILLACTFRYPDDVIIHGSDYAPDGKDNNGYFRAMGTLADNKLMMGNCRKAVAGWGHNEMCVGHRETMCGSQGVIVKQCVCSTDSSDHSEVICVI